MGKGLNTCICVLWIITYLMHFFHVPDPKLLFAIPLAVCLTVCLWKSPTYALGIWPLLSLCQLYKFFDK